MGARVERVFVLLEPKGVKCDDSWIQRYLARLTGEGMLPAPTCYRAEKRQFTEVRERSKSVNVLRPKDAAHLYLEAHRAATLVIAAPSVRILLDPRRDPASPRTICRPEVALRHKAIVWAVLRLDDLEQRMSLLCSPHPCDDIAGVSDPRVLPLHLFDAPDVDDHLGTPEGRARFKDSYRHRGAWTASNTRWQDAAPGARHGVDRAADGTFVSGWRVPEGHHWDVQPSDRKAELVGFGEVWSLKQSGHVNVFPNGRLLGSHRAARVWPRG